MPYGGPMGGAVSYERGNPVTKDQILVTKSMSLKYDPASEPLHISVK